MSEEPLFSLRTDVALVPAGSPATRHILLTLTAPEPPRADSRGATVPGCPPARPSLHVSFVLDRSGSMGGSRSPPRPRRGPPGAADAPGRRPVRPRRLRRRGGRCRAVDRRVRRGEAERARPAGGDRRPRLDRPCGRLARGVRAGGAAPGRGASRPVPAPHRRPRQRRRDRPEPAGGAGRVAAAAAHRDVHVRRRRRTSTRTCCSGWRSRAAAASTSSSGPSRSRTS